LGRAWLYLCLPRRNCYRCSYWLSLVARNWGVLRICFDFFQRQKTDVSAFIFTESWIPVIKHSSRHWIPVKKHSPRH
jgi:hypothetical protein